MSADKTSSGVRIKKGRRFWRITGLSALGCLPAAGIFVLFAFMPTRAGAATLPQEITALQAAVAALQSQVNIQNGQITSLQSQVGSLQTSNTTLQGQIGTLQGLNTSLGNLVATLDKQVIAAGPVLALAPFVSVDPNPKMNVIGPHIIFRGANIHIESGLGTTADTQSGLGNLIIGYDEDLSSLHLPGQIVQGDRSGSHNLVIGRGNRFKTTAFGGIVAGEANTISNEADSVSGGLLNTASGIQASVSGGQTNNATGFGASVSGGQINTASGNSAVSAAARATQPAARGPVSAVVLAIYRPEAQRSSSAARVTAQVGILG